MEEEDAFEEVIVHIKQFIASTFIANKIRNLVKLLSLDYWLQNKCTGMGQNSPCIFPQSELLLSPTYATQLMILPPISSFSQWSPHIPVHILHCGGSLPSELSWRPPSSSQLHSSLQDPFHFFSILLSPSFSKRICFLPDFAPHSLHFLFQVLFCFHIFLSFLGRLVASFHLTVWHFLVGNPTHRVVLSVRPYVRTSVHENCQHCNRLL